MISLLIHANVPIYSGGVLAIYVFTFVQGIMTLHDTLAFVLVSAWVFLSTYLRWWGIFVFIFTHFTAFVLSL